MLWTVIATPEFREWFSTLETDQAAAVLAVLEQLQTHGPTLGRPHADHVKGTDRHFNIKELRPRGNGKNLRVLYIFDPDRKALLLVGWDKTGAWSKSYRQKIEQAEALYDQYLDDRTKKIDTGKKNDSGRSKR